VGVDGPITMVMRAMVTSSATDTPKSPAPKDRTLLILVLAALAEFALATLGVNLVHLGCSTRTSVLEHLRQLEKIIGRRSPIFFGPLRSGTTKSIAPVPSGKRASGSSLFRAATTSETPCTVICTPTYRHQKRQAYRPNHGRDSVANGFGR
jgi:hypothetical protein